MPNIGRYFAMGLYISAQLSAEAFSVFFPPRLHQDVCGGWRALEYGDCAFHTEAEVREA